MCGKIGYANPTEAYKVAQRMREKRAGAAYAYRCTECHRWHLAHRNDRQDRLRKQEKVKRDAKRRAKQQARSD